MWQEVRNWVSTNWRRIVLIAVLLVGAAIIWRGLNSWDWSIEQLPAKGIRVTVTRQMQVLGAPERRAECCDPSPAPSPAVVDCCSSEKWTNVTIAAGVYDDRRTHIFVNKCEECGEREVFILLPALGGNFWVRPSDLGKAARIERFDETSRYTWFGWVLIGVILGLLVYALWLGHGLLMAQPAAPAAPAPAPAGGAPPPPAGGPNP